jgi:hypothetical protein
MACSDQAMQRSIVVRPSVPSHRRQPGDNDHLCYAVGSKAARVVHRMFRSDMIV